MKKKKEKNISPEQGWKSIRLFTTSLAISNHNMNFVNILKQI